MGFFVNENTLNGYSYNSGYHTDLYSPSDYTIYDEGVDINYTTLGYEIVAESQQEWNTLMKQVALNELAVYSSNGCREVLYEAVDFSALFTRIKNFFKKLVDKVKAIFHSFMAKLSSILSRDSTFAKKYGNEFIRKVQNIRDDFEFKGYTFTIKKFSNRDDITFDSQLANIYINKAKVGETKIDNSIVNLLNSRGSVSDSLLNPSTFVESVGYYGDYYILNEYKISNVKNEYDKIYILHNIFTSINNYNNLFSHDDDYIENLYKNKTVLNDEQKKKVNEIFNKLNYSSLIKKIKPGVTTYGELHDLASIFEKILSGPSTNNFKNIAKQFNIIGHNSSFNMKANKNDIDTLLNELRKNYIINPNLLGKYNPETSSSGSTSNSGGNSGGSRSSGGISESGSVSGRNIDYNSPAEKADVYKRANISIQDNSEDIHDTIRGAVAKLYTDNSSAADSYSERDFKNELFKLFRNGADKKDSIPASEIKKNASAIVDEVTTYKNTKDMAKESTNTVVKAIDSVINKLDEYIKRSNKNWTEGSDGTLTTNFTNLLTTITNVFFKTSRSDIVLANNIYLTALKDRCIQNKNIMVKVIAGYDSKKMKNTNESYDYGYNNDYIYNNNSNSFLDNIIFK